jgi:hypothetical protein
VNSLNYADQKDAQSIWSTEGSEKSMSALADGASAFAMPARLEKRDGIVGLDDRWGGATAKKQAQKWLGRSYSLWTQWTSYLVDYSLRPHNQLSTDDFAGWLALQTNLALKGIVGIKAMSELANVMGKEKDVEYYRNISSVYIEKWEEYGMSRDGGRAKLAYDWHGSWTTLYSLYADAILCFHPTFTENGTSSSDFHLNSEQAPIIDNSGKKSGKDFIPDHIYQTQSEWYLTAMQKYGVGSLLPTKVVYDHH